MPRRLIAARTSSTTRGAVSASSSATSPYIEHRDEVMDDDRYEAFHTERPSSRILDTQELPHTSLNPSAVRYWMNSLWSSLVCSLIITLCLATLMSHLEHLVRRDKVAHAATLAQQTLPSLISDDDLLSVSQPRPLFVWMKSFWYLSLMLCLVNILLCLSAYGWLASYKNRPPHLDAANFRYAGLSYRHILFVADSLTPLVFSFAILSMALGLALYVSALSYIGGAIMAITVGNLFLLYIALALELYFPSP